MRVYIFLACALQAASAAGALLNTVVYQNDFESNTAGFSNLRRNYLPIDAAGFASDNQSLFLGPFSNGVGATSTLTLSGLTAGATHNISFDLFIGQSWNGNSLSMAPNTWKLTVANAAPAALVDTTFLNMCAGDGIVENLTQSYSDADPVGPGSFAAFTGADVARTSPGPGEFLDRYAIYYFGHGAGNPILSFIPTGTTAALTFTAGLTEGVNDEFWAIDNVVVTVPEPGSFLACTSAAGILLFTKIGRMRRTRTTLAATSD